MKPTIIKSSNKKFLLLSAGSLMFTIFSILFIMIPNKFTTLLIRSTISIQFIGILGLSFFGLALFMIIKKKIFDKHIGIEINEEGIIDNSSFVGVGLIKWEDIISIDKRNVQSTRFLLINVRNPQHYISNSSRFKSKLLNGNYKVYGTPISISANFINCTFTQLEEIVLNNFERFKKNNVQ